MVVDLLLEVQVILPQSVLRKVIQEEFQEQELVPQEKVAVVAVVQELLEQIMQTLTKELQVVQD